ncbi:hypothetical protein K469DRAFT_379616 [Zopfia rhizophila CBS 207.26]|uniref:RING-type domain-containing protein n=1 Tax=Zopfia rhizophila CBS 207.26 TaxID=1314779 RepID=A0A6A6DGX8_9PEZI|nr:hypothetical protein K469DRAFT_379616 [Zopfia rhizophila CBS 207.26]
MAESNFSPPPQDSYLGVPNPPVAHSPHLETAAQALPFSPAFANYHASFSFQASGFQQYDPIRHGSQVPGSALGYTPLSSFRRARGGQFHQMSPPASNSAGYGSYVPYRPSGPIPYHGLQMPGSPQSELPQSRNDTDMALPLQFEHGMTTGAPAFSVPHLQVPPHLMQSFDLTAARPLGFIPPGPPSPPTVPLDTSVTTSTTPPRGSVRGANPGQLDQGRHFSSPSGRSYERPHRHYPQGHQGPDRRPEVTSHRPPSNGAHPRRPGRSASPRTTSHRRTFDRYAVDLDSRTASAAAETDEPTARRRRQEAHERVQERFPERQRHFPQFRRPHFVVDGNSTTASQMQALRDKLRHFLPTQLPKGSSKQCDICQKDYSAKHVDPSEEEEVAIQLPCKHVFGEHCINTWFETCKTHKNKITCPMCRKLLIEPIERFPPSFFPAAAAMPELMEYLSRREHLSPADLARLSRELDSNDPRI